MRIRIWASIYLQRSVELSLVSSISYLFNSLLQYGEFIFNQYHIMIAPSKYRITSILNEEIFESQPNAQKNYSHTYIMINLTSKISVICLDSGHVILCDEVSYD